MNMQSRTYILYIFVLGCDIFAALASLIMGVAAVSTSVGAQALAAGRLLWNPLYRRGEFAGPLEGAV